MLTVHQHTNVCPFNGASPKSANHVGLDCNTKKTEKHFWCCNPNSKKKSLKNSRILLKSTWRDLQNVPCKMHVKWHYTAKCREIARPKNSGKSGENSRTGYSSVQNHKMLKSHAKKETSYQIPGWVIFRGWGISPGCYGILWGGPICRTKQP